MLTHVSVVALIGLSGGCGLVVTSMVTSRWIVFADHSYLGLFSHCSANNCIIINSTTTITTAVIATRETLPEFKAVRGLVITGLIIAICGNLMALGFVVDAVRSKGVKSLSLLRSSLIMNPLAGIVIMLGASVFAATLYGNTVESKGATLGYSFGLCVSGGTSIVVSGILVYIGGPRKVTIPSREHSLSPPRVVLACVQPPPLYLRPSEQFLIAEFHSPPAYEEKIQPPSYEEALLLPPTYEETRGRLPSPRPCTCQLDLF